MCLFGEHLYSLWTAQCRADQHASQDLENTEKVEIAFETIAFLMRASSAAHRLLRRYELAMLRALRDKPAP